MTKDKAVEQLIQKANAWRDTRRGKYAASSGEVSPDYKHAMASLDANMMCVEEHELAVAIDNLMVAD